MSIPRPNQVFSSRKPMTTLTTSHRANLLHRVAKPLSPKQVGPLKSGTPARTSVTYFCQDRFLTFLSTEDTHTCMHLPARAMCGVTRKTTRGTTLPVFVTQKGFETEKRDQILIEAHVWANELT
jgi:hypothetical protein